MGMPTQGRLTVIGLTHGREARQPSTTLLLGTAKAFWLEEQNSSPDMERQGGTWWYSVYLESPLSLLPMSACLWFPS